MINNPFILVGEIPGPYFCDRQRELERLTKAMYGGENICLVSARRMGKSKLVKHWSLLPDVKDNCYFFYVDLLHTSTLRDFAFSFGRCVFDVLQSRGEKFVRQFLTAVRSLSATMTMDPLSGMPQFVLSLNQDAQLEYTFDSIFKYLEDADKPCVVCFDEFQQIVNYPEKNVESSADRQSLTRVVNGIIEAETPRYARMLSHVPERQQKLLFAIAKEGKVQKIMSGQFLRKYGLISSSMVQNAIRHLLDLDLVTVNDDKQYTVEDIFLRMYLNRISD